MTPEQIRDLPASWYANQPIPHKLLVDLGRDFAFNRRGGKTPREIEQTLRPRTTTRLSVVEQAHVRATNRLLRL